MGGSRTGSVFFAMVLPFLLLAPVYGQLRAGAAKSEITPDVGGHTIYLAGFGHDRIATAVHDPLYVRCLALQAGRSTLVLCSADLIGLFYEDVQAIRQKFHAQAPAGALLIVACTHVHEGPDTLGLWGPTAVKTGVDASYLDWIETRIAETAVEAIRSLAPAYIRLARDDHPLLGQLQSVDRPPYVKDPHLFVMQLLRTSNDTTVATLVNWSDHPETLNRKNTAISADYPGSICQYLERRYSGTALFFNAAVGKVSTLGNQVALLDPETGRVADDGAWRKPELLGNLIGQLAEDALARAERYFPDALVLRSSLFFLPLANDRFRMAEAAGVFGLRRPLFTGGKTDSSTAEREVDHQTVPFATGHDLQSEVDYAQLRAGSRLLAEFVTVPGEIFPELVNGGIRRYPGADFPDAAIENPLRAMLRTKYQFIIGLGNDEMGYIIPKAEWDERAPWLNNSPQAFYGEINSAGPDTAAWVVQAIADLVGRAAARRPQK
jgi:hypothetical protein